MSSTMSTSPLRLIARSSSKPENSERYTSAELMERLQEIDLPGRRRSAPRRAASYPTQNDNTPSGQPSHVSSFETTDANGHHQTIDCYNIGFMDLPPRAELDDMARQPKLLFSDVLHTNYQAGTAMPKKPCPSVPDLSLEKQMECAIFAVNAPIYINRARQQANRMSPALPSFPNFSGVHCSPSSSTTTAAAANIPTVSVPGRSPAESHDGCAASTCSCCVTCSTCPTLPSPPASTIGRSSRMRGHRVLEAIWARRRGANAPSAPVQQPANTLTFSRRPVPSVQQQPQGLIGHLLTAVRQDMLRGNSNNSSKNSNRQHVSFAPLPQRPHHHRPLALPAPRPHHDGRLLPENGLTASETAALHALVDGLSQHGIIANDDSPPVTPSPPTTTTTPRIAYPPTHPLFPTFAGLTSSFSSFLSSSSESEHSSQHSSFSSSSSSRSSISIPPPTPLHGHNYRKVKLASQTQMQRADSVMEISTSYTSSVSERDQHQSRGDTHVTRFQRLFGARVRVEDLPGAFSSCESGGACEVGYEYEEEGSV